MFFKKKEKQESYDKESLIPILHASICTGETVAGFKNKKTGQFTEVMLIRTPHDLEEFMKRYNITEPLKKEY